MSEIHVFTSAAANYLPKVRALFASIERLHPEWSCHLLLAEDLTNATLDELQLPWPTLQLRDLDIPEWRSWAFCHSLVELCTAVKPFMLKKLLAREDCRGVLYFDPDTLLFSRLDDVVSAIDHHAVLLTPHQTAPETTLEGVIGNEITSLRFGAYNLGFIGVAANSVGADFAHWWSQRLYRFCRDDPARGLFTDQRWIDLVPSLFESVAILRDSRLNVAAWNWNQRRLSVVGDDFYCDDKPLGFYHFTGLDSGNHALMLEKFPANREAVEALLAVYRESVALYARLYSGSDWSFARLDSGDEVTAEWRQRYRDEPTLQAKFPDPWADGLRDWLVTHPTDCPADDYLSAGFQGGRPALDMTRALQHLRTAVSNPSLGKKMLGHARKVLRREGLNGIRRRLARNTE